ncbi:MAG: hypothetical protein AB8G15_16400 [Saprospiraceae bacterium]
MTHNPWRKMKVSYNYPTINYFALLIWIGTLSACTNAPSSASTQADEAADQAMEVAEALSFAPEHALESRYDQQTLSRLQGQVVETTQRYQERYQSGHLFYRLVEEKDFYGDVHFYNGKAVRAAWHDDAVGQNGQYLCHFNEAGEVNLIECFSHNGQSYQASFHQRWEEDIISFSHHEAFREGSRSAAQQASYDVKGSWISLTDFRNISYKARQLLEAAISSQRATAGTRYYLGTINNEYPIQAKLDLYDNLIHGYYHYENSESALKLVGRVKGGVLKLAEQQEEKKEVTGSFIGTVAADGNIEGTWFNADSSRSFSFELRLSDHYTDVDGTILKSLPSLQPEIFHQAVKTNYFDLPAEYQAKAGEILGSAKLGKLPFNGAGITRLKDFLFQEFIESPAYEEQGYDDHGSRPTQQYFNDIYLPLPDFIGSAERHTGYYANSKTSLGFERRLLSYLVYRIDRTPENIDLIWKMYKKEIFRLIDYEMYEDFEINQTVNDLLQSYKHFKTVDQIEVQLDAIYQFVHSSNQNDPSAAFDEHILTAWSAIATGDVGNYKRKDWAYSFWMRRNHEKNLEAVATILKEFQAYYSHE